MIKTEAQMKLVERYKTMRSVGDRVLIEPQNDIEGEEVTKGGIIIPSTTRRSKPFREGRVLSAGPRCEVVKEGDYVMWPTQVGYFADGGYGYQLMSLQEKELVVVLSK